MDISKIRMGEKYSLSVPQSELSDEGQFEILYTLMSYTGLEPGTISNSLPADWSWEPKVAHGTYAGTLSKRLQSFLYKTFKAKLPDEVVSLVGNIASQHTLDANDFFFDFDNSLVWDMGDFGDSGSCFWTEKPYALPMLSHFGGFAMRQYDQRGKGIGRCLILPYLTESVGYDPERWKVPDALIVFNGYGHFSAKYESSRSGQHYGRAQVLDYARLLALFLGVSYQRIKLSINGETSSPLYINNEGNGIAVAPVETLSAWRPRGKSGNKVYKALNIDWPKSEMRKFLLNCSDCGHSMVIGPGSGAMLGGQIAPNGEAYCSRCFSRHFGPCYVCNQIIDLNEAGQVRVRTLSAFNGGIERIYMCREHMEEQSFTCPYCRGSYHISDRRLFHIGNRGSEPKRVVCCAACYNGILRVTPCPTCSRDYAAKQLIVKTVVEGVVQPRVSIGDCPQCRSRARRRAKLEDEDVGHQRYLSISPSLVLPTLDQLRERVLARLRGSNLPPPSVVAAPPDDDLPPEVRAAILLEIRYIVQRGWEPVVRGSQIGSYTMRLPRGSWEENISLVERRVRYELTRCHPAYRFSVRNVTLGLWDSATRIAYVQFVETRSLPADIPLDMFWEITSYLLERIHDIELEPESESEEYLFEPVPPNRLDRFIEVMNATLEELGHHAVPRENVRLVHGLIRVRFNQEIQSVEEAQDIQGE